jgi:hypothetical protein
MRGPRLTTATRCPPHGRTRPSRAFPRQHVLGRPQQPRQTTGTRTSPADAQRRPLLLRRAKHAQQKPRPRLSRPHGTDVGADCMACDSMAREAHCPRDACAPRPAFFTRSFVALLTQSLTPPRRPALVRQHATDKEGSVTQECLRGECRPDHDAARAGQNQSELGSGYASG